MNRKKKNKANWPGTAIALFYYMKAFTVISLSLAFSLKAFSLVDMKNASYFDSWTDLIFPEHSNFFKIERSYSSRSLHDGIFGFGWCSLFEKKLTKITKKQIEVDHCGRKKLFKKNKKHFTNPQTQAKISIKKKSFILEDGTTKIHFSENGRIAFIQYSDEEQLVFKYKKSGSLYRIMDSHGHMVFFHYNKKGRVGKVKSFSGLEVFYKYENSNLVFVKNIWNNSFSMKYDSFHNLTSIHYPDNTSKQITYNVDRDWVTSFRSRTHCLEKYSYEENEKHYTSTVKKYCKRKLVTTARYQFWHNQNIKGENYLSRINFSKDDENFDILYSPNSGKPVEIRKGDFFFILKYKDNGQLAKVKTSDDQTLKFSYSNQNSRLPSSIADQKGAKLHITYHSSGEIKKVFSNSKEKTTNRIISFFTKYISLSQKVLN